ncbi:MAG: hypothetical protein Q4C05_04615 [Akkermansia sp.]|nr:hypothetical protein [Akkermansia sp.]
MQTKPTKPPIQIPLPLAYAEILEFMERTAQAPNYWNHVRRETYITGTRLQEADLR